MRARRSLADLGEGTWRVATEDGTRIFLDLDERLYRREPAASPDAGLPGDGDWVRLGWGPFVVGDDGVATTSGVAVGAQVWLGRGLLDDLTTARVAAIDDVDPVDAPPPNPPRIACSDAGEWTAWTGDLPVSGDGATMRASLVGLGQGIDAWLDEAARHGGERRRSALWWSRAVDVCGSVVPAVLAAHDVRTPGTAGWERCPHCCASLRGDPIPEERADRGDRSTFGSIATGVEITGVLEGVLYWIHAHGCWGAWPRWLTDERLAPLSEQYAAAHNRRELFGERGDE